MVISSTRYVYACTRVTCADVCRFCMQIMCIQNSHCELILAWCRIYMAWKTDLIPLLTNICVTNSCIFFIDLQNSVRHKWCKTKFDNKHHALTIDQIIQHFVRMQYSVSQCSSAMLEIYGSISGGIWLHTDNSSMFFADDRARVSALQTMKS